MAKKGNKQFMILSAIGIIMVVDSHLWTAASIGTAVFPYNSFFMAMFMFISGYFFDRSYKKFDSDPISYIKNKTKKLMVPYIIWQLFYAVLINFLRLVSPLRIGSDFDLFRYIVGPFVFGEQFGINAPGYFVPILFYVSCIFAFLFFLFKGAWNDYLMCLLFVCLGGGMVRYAILSDIGHVYYSFLPMLVKVLFSLQFFELGILYNRKLEKMFTGIHPAAVMLCSVIIMRILQHYCGNLSWSLNRLSFNPEFLNMGYAGVVLPFVSSCLGISFWLSVSKVLVPSLGESRLCNFISNHTFDIMMNHVLFMAMTNWILAIINRFHAISGLNVEEILRSSWYRFEWNGTKDFYIFYFIAGIVGAVCMAKAVDLIKAYLKQKPLKEGFLHRQK